MVINLNKNIKVNIDGFTEFTADAPFSDFGQLVRKKSN